MKNIESLLIESLKHIGSTISKSEYLTSLLEKKQKFEGWFQVELARCLYEKLNKNASDKVLIEGQVDKNRYADVLIERNDDKDIAIEIKFIIKGKATTDARKGLLNQMHKNAIKHHSYGIAVLAAENDNKWFQKESDRIETYCKEKEWKEKLCKKEKCNIVFSYDYPGKLFCIKLLKHEKVDSIAK